MLGSGLRNLFDRLSRDMGAKADSTFGSLMVPRNGDDPARDEFITAYIVAPEPVRIARKAKA